MSWRDRRAGPNGWMEQLPFAVRLLIFVVAVALMLWAAVGRFGAMQDGSLGWSAVFTTA